MSAPSVGPATKPACQNWKAWHDFMPGAEPTLYVRGECTFPTQGYAVSLSRAVPQGINPSILLLKKTVIPPKGLVGQQITTLEVAYSERTATKFTKVQILGDEDVEVSVDVEIVS